MREKGKPRKAQRFDHEKHEMKKEWNDTKLGDVLELLYGKKSGE